MSCACAVLHFLAKKNGALREGELESLKTRILNQESITPDEEDFLLDQVQASVERRTLFKRVEKLGIKDSLQGGDEEEEKEQESKQEEGSKPMLIGFLVFFAFLFPVFFFTPRFLLPFT